VDNEAGERHAHARGDFLGHIHRDWRHDGARLRQRQEPGDGQEGEIAAQQHDFAGERGRAREHGAGVVPGGEQVGVSVNAAGDREAGTAGVPG
jgi:hypothetical protein